MLLLFLPLILKCNLGIKFAAWYLLINLIHLKGIKENINAKKRNKFAIMD